MLEYVVLIWDMYAMIFLSIWWLREVIRKSVYINGCIAVFFI